MSLLGTLNLLREDYRARKERMAILRDPRAFAQDQEIMYANPTEVEDLFNFPGTRFIGLCKTGDPSSDKRQALVSVGDFLNLGLTAHLQLVDVYRPNSYGVRL